jgi:D-alanyl-D-alanine carboxypeptidase
MKKIIAILIMAIILFVLTACNNEEKPSNVDEQSTTEKGNVSKNEFVVIGIEKYALAGEIIEITIDKSDVDFDVKVFDEGLKVDKNKVSIPKNALTGDVYRIEVYNEDYSYEHKFFVANMLSKTVDESGVITNPSAYDAVVNKIRNLPADYIPPDLVTVNVPTCLPNPEIRQLRKEAADALYNMFEAAKKDGINLVARSGYRSYNTQVSLYDGYVKNYGQEYADKYSAVPGQSEHQTGLAMDITAESVGLKLEDSFGETKEGKWTMENSYKFGFIIRYPEGMENITGYLYEPWHLRYLGVELATEVYEKGLTLEEYFEIFEQ